MFLVHSDNCLIFLILNARSFLFIVSFLPIFLLYKNFLSFRVVVFCMWLSSVAISIREDNGSSPIWLLSLFSTLFRWKKPVLDLAFATENARQSSINLRMYLYILFFWNNQVFFGIILEVLALHLQQGYLNVSI